MDTLTPAKEVLCLIYKEFLLEKRANTKKKIFNIIDKKEPQVVEELHASIQIFSEEVIEETELKRRGEISSSKNSLNNIQFVRFRRKIRECFGKTGTSQSLAKSIWSWLIDQDSFHEVQLDFILLEKSLLNNNVLVEVDPEIHSFISSSVCNIDTDVQDVFGRFKNLSNDQSRDFLLRGKPLPICSAIPLLDQIADLFASKYSVSCRYRHLICNTAEISHFSKFLSTVAGTSATQPNPELASMPKGGLIQFTAQNHSHSEPKKEHSIFQILNDEERHTETRIPSNPIYQVPEPTQTFVGRKNEIQRIRETLGSGREPIRLAIEALPGTGKTELAIHCARKFAAEGLYPGGVFWLNAENTDLTFQWSGAIAERLGIVDHDPGKETGLAVIRKIQNSRKRTLLVLDNVIEWSNSCKPNPLPESQNVEVLVTTQKKDFSGQRFISLELGFLNKDDSIELLENIAGNKISELDGFDDLVSHFDGHALGLELAAVYFKKLPGTAISFYLSRYTSIPESLNSKFALLTNYEKTTHKAFLCLWDAIDQETRSQWLLAAQFQPGPVSTDFSDAVGLDKFSRSNLRDFHLIQGEEKWTMHRSVIGFARGVREHELQENAQEKFLAGAALLAFKREHIVGFRINRCDQKHFCRVIELKERLTDSFSFEGFKLDNIASVLCMLGYHQNAKTLLKRAVDLDLAKYSEEHPNVRARRSGLASVLAYLGEYKEAKTLFQQVLESELKEFGDEHYGLSPCRYNLALVLIGLQEYKEAKILLQQALDSELKCFPNENPKVTACRSDLALTLKRLGRYEEAKILLQQALESVPKNSGDQYMMVEFCRGRLALALIEFGEYEDAKTLLQDDLDSSLKNSGDSYSPVSSLRRRLATLLIKQREFKEAKELLVQSLDSNIEIFGSDHPLVAEVHTDLAIVLKHMGKTRGAKREALIARKIASKLSKENPIRLRVFSETSWLDGRN